MLYHFRHSSSKYVIKWAKTFFVLILLLQTWKDVVRYVWKPCLWFLDFSCFWNRSNGPSNTKSQKYLIVWNFVPRGSLKKMIRCDWNFFCVETFFSPVHGFRCTAFGKNTASIGSTLILVLHCHTSQWHHTYVDHTSEVGLLLYLPQCLNCWRSFNGSEIAAENVLSNHVRVRAVLQRILIRHSHCHRQCIIRRRFCQDLLLLMKNSFSWILERALNLVIWYKKQESLV